MMLTGRDTSAPVIDAGTCLVREPSNRLPMQLDINTCNYKIQGVEQSPQPQVSPAELSWASCKDLVSLTLYDQV